MNKSKFLLYVAFAFFTLAAVQYIPGIRPLVGGHWGWLIPGGLASFVLAGLV